MQKNTLVFSILAVTSLNIPLHTEETQEVCGTSPRSHRGSIRHIESKGVGYTQGYTSVDFFVASNRSTSSLVPFIDTRFHIFNNGQPALNAGLGLRYLTSSWVYGINSYYDYRKTHRFHYNQFALGLEALGKRWDVRLNGYLPVGKKKSDLYKTKFSYFKDHYAFLSSRQEFAMRGLNLEAGCHLKKMKHASFYAAAGPYYFYNEGKNAIGGEARVSATLYDHLKLEANGSYDPVFKGIGQGQISVLFPFGPKARLKKGKNTSCSNQLILRERALQPVDRSEIIVLDRTRQTSKAINPDTGLPYKFVFVNNTSSSNGTFESPFPTLAQAQNASNTHDIIYVFEGNGNSYNAGSGFYLKDNQKFWGSGTTQNLNTTLGMIPIANQTSGLPLITGGVAELGILNLANNNEISGVHLRGISGTTGFGILGGNRNLYSVTNSVIQNNTLDGTYSQSGIRLTGQGTASFALNTLNITVGNSGGSYSGLEVFAIHSEYLKSEILNENTINVTTFDDNSAIALLISSGGIGSNIASTIIGTNTFNAETNGNGNATGILLAATGNNATFTSAIVGGNTIDSSVNGTGSSFGVLIESTGISSSIISSISGTNQIRASSSVIGGEGVGFAYGIQAISTGAHSRLYSMITGSNQVIAASTGTGTAYGTVCYSLGAQSNISTSILGSNIFLGNNTYTSGSCIGIDLSTGTFGSAVSEATLTAQISQENIIRSNGSGTGSSTALRLQSSGVSALTLTTFGPNTIDSIGTTSQGIKLTSLNTSTITSIISDGIFTVEGRSGGTATGILATQTGGTISGLIEHNTGTVSGATTNTTINTSSAPNVRVRNNSIIAD